MLGNFRVLVFRFRVLTCGLSVPTACVCTFLNQIHACSSSTTLGCSNPSRIHKIAICRLFLDIPLHKNSSLIPAAAIYTSSAQRECSGNLGAAGIHKSE